jgi:alcohol dehydrogenase (cytochrome c)
LPRRVLVHGALATAAFLVFASGAASARDAQDWPLPNGDLAGTRAAPASAITDRTVGRLVERWRFRFRGGGTDFSVVTATPVIAGNTVYVQDSKSSVYALDRETGRLRWARLYAAPNDGPNGVAVARGRVFAVTDTTAFALRTRDGRRLWSRRLVDADEQFVDIAPVVSAGRVYLSTVGFPPGGRGALYALDARTGARLWKFETVKQRWRHSEAGGGGAWYPLSVDDRGNVYAGISNPGPWGGTKAFPNGRLFRGRTLYMDSLVVLEGRTGKLLWYDQVTRHDVRDYDFQATPILARLGRPRRDVAFGAGKAGRVVSWDRRSRKRLWARAVGTHLNDTGPLPRVPVPVCPGLFGGVLTPMAYAAGTLFVPVVELCMRESAVRPFSALQRRPESGRGALYALDGATGGIRWSRRFGSPLFGCATAAGGVVFAPTYDGGVWAISARTGAVLWSARARAGINACPSVAGDLLLVPAGAPHRAFRRPVPELIAFGLPGR